MEDNKKTIRFICPDCGKTVEERRKELLGSIEEWVDSEALSSMVSAFGGSIPKGSLKERIDWLDHFANVWDYRKKQAGNERWFIEEDPVAKANVEVITASVKELGLVDIETPLVMPDYILPLGGARRSNFARPETAKKVIDQMNIRDRKIVALSGTRLINDMERPFIEDFAEGAETEYEAISKGLETVFSLKGERFREERSRHENIYLQWALRTYEETYQGNTIQSLAAPSSDPGRRANSRDTFLFFLEKFQIRPGDRLLLVTSCIYVPFQILRFMDLAIEKGFYVDCVGMPNDDRQGTSFSRITNYCQETKAAINAVKSIADLWL